MTTRLHINAAAPGITVRDGGWLGCLFPLTPPPTGLLDAGDELVFMSIARSAFTAPGVRAAAGGAVTYRQAAS